MSPTPIPQFYCRPLKINHLKRWRRKWIEVTTYEVYVLHICITICRPSFFPVWKAEVSYSFFSPNTQKKTTAFETALAAKIFHLKLPYISNDTDLIYSRKNLKKWKDGFNRNFLVGKHFWKYYWCLLFLQIFSASLQVFIAGFHCNQKWFYYKFLYYLVTRSIGGRQTR